MHIKLFFMVLLFAAIAYGQRRTRRRPRTTTTTEAPLTGNEAIEDLQKTVKALKGQLSQVSRQLMLQQFFTEEKIRGEGFSGIKQVRTGLGIKVSLHSIISY